MKYHFFLGFLAVVSAYPGVIHEDTPQVEEKFDHNTAIGESDIQHHVVHDHAKSHQSIKFEHFHPVPVYIKKEHSHLLKHPLEKGKSEQELKQIHPETHPSHGGGLVLEDHRFNTEHLVHELHHGDSDQSSLDHGGFEHGGFEHAGLEHLQGGYEGGEGLKEYTEFQHAQPQYEHQGFAGGSGEAYKYEGY